MMEDLGKNPTTTVDGELRQLQLRHGRWVVGLTMVAIFAAIGINLANDTPQRALLFLGVSLPVGWVLYRMWLGFLGSAEKWVSIVSATCYFMIPVWTNAAFDEAWRGLTALSGVMTVTAAFGFHALFPMVLSLLTAALIRWLVVQQFGADIFFIDSGNVKLPIISLWFYLVIDCFFLLLLGKQVTTAQQLITRARDEAVTARAAESRFLSNMSHEIRNPLQGIQGLLEAIHSKATSAEVINEADLAMQVTERLKSLLNDVLDYKKLLEGKLAINPHPFDSESLRKALRGTTLALLQNSKKDLEYQFHKADDLPQWVYGDDNRIFQILINLVSNAIKFTDSGSIIVKVHYDVNTERVLIRIADTGPGMSQETINHLFERFRQGSEGLSKAHEGTGLGLAISHELVTLMGGSLSVESELGIGSTFQVELPLPRSHQPATAHSSTRVDVGVLTSTREDLSGLTFLCVDDDLLNLRVLKVPLSQAKATVLTANSGEEALELLESHGVHMVLTDISMPGMDGTALQQEIAQRFPGLPVIAVTGNAMPDDIARYLSLGFIDVLGKPFKREELLEFVGRNIAAAFGELWSEPAAADGVIPHSGSLIRT